MANTIFDPWEERDVPVRDIREDVKKITEANPPSEQSIEGFLDHRRHLVQDVDVTGVEIHSAPLVPTPGGVGVGVYFKENLIGFSETTTMYWWIVAPKFLGGPSRSLVYLTSSNQAARGTEALVEYCDQLPAVFRIWDWATPPQANGSRFVVSIPFANWGDHHIPVTIDGTQHHALYVVNRTLRVGPDLWANDVLVYDNSTRSFDWTWHYEHTWRKKASVYFGWGPIIEPFMPYDFQTTNVVGYAKARLVTDKINAILAPGNSRIVQRNVGFETIFSEPNHTLLAQ
jgi:hypothetical protein